MPGYFNPLPPHGGRRYQDIMYDRNRNISIHSLRMEGDSTKRKQQELDRKISIHSLRMEGDVLTSGVFQELNISIHSLRMEGDYGYSDASDKHRHFNPLPPHGGRRLRVRHGILTWLFQSTPSAWRETVTLLIISLIS